MLCADCDGSGHYLTAIRISGEMVDSDYAERPCETCDGLGEVDHLCPDDRMCPDCGSIPLHILHERCREPLVKVEDLGPGRVAA